MMRAKAGMGVVGLLLLGVVALVGGASPAAAAIGEITTFDDAGVVDPDQLAAADDGTMWFTATAVVGSITPAGTITTSNDATIVGGTRDVAVGGDDSVWFSTSTGLVRRDPTSATFTAIPISGLAPTLLTTTSDGEIWFVDEGNDVWSIPADGLTTTPALEEDLDPSTGDEVISDLAADPAGGIWAIQPAGTLGSLIHVDADGHLTATILTEESKVAGQGTRIAAGADGTVWFTPADDVMGRFTPADGIDVLPITAQASALAVGADGNVWYRPDGLNATIDRLEPDGQVTPFPDPEDEVQSTQWMAAGTDGQIWFSDDDTDRIGFIETIQAPDAPTAFQAVGGNGHVSLSWTPPTDTGGADLTGYRLTRIGGLPVELPASETSYVVGGLTNGTTYEFELVAQNAAGDSLATFDLATPRTVPGQPTGLTAAAGDAAGDVDLAWTAPAASNGAPVTGYVLYRDDVVIATLAGDVVEYVDEDLPDGAYAYQVAAESAAGVGQRSTTAIFVVGQQACTDEEARFEDVSEAHPFYEDVCWAAVQGITTGYDDGTFRPTASVTRQSMSAFLYRLAGEPTFTPPATASFDDVSTGHPFFAEVEWMADEGITTGFDDGTYRPGASVSRQAMSAFLYRLAGEPSFAAPEIASFLDVAADHQFLVPIEWMVAEGITTGYPEDLFKPSGLVSRQSMAVFMRRLDAGPGVGL